MEVVARLDVHEGSADRKHLTSPSALNPLSPWQLGTVNVTLTSGAALCWLSPPAAACVTCERTSGRRRRAAPGVSGVRAAMACSGDVLVAWKPPEGG